MTDTSDPGRALLMSSLEAAVHPPEVTLMKAPSIAIAPDVSQYFQEVIADAIRVRHVEATDAAASYLVSLLCEYAHPDEAAGSTLHQPPPLLPPPARKAPRPQRLPRLQGGVGPP